VEAARGTPSRGWVPIYLLGAITAALIVTVVMETSLPAIPSSHSFVHLGRMSVNIGTSAVLLFVLDAVLVGPIAEEVMFRGILLPWLGSWMSERVGLAVSSVLFGAAHIGYGYGALIPAASGWVLGWARQQTGSLKASIALHMGLNRTVLALALTTGSARMFLAAGILLLVLVGGGSLVDDAAYRAQVEALWRSRRIP
jgi:membrane protease YdiL (CAAX protease family)